MLFPSAAGVISGNCVAVTFGVKVAVGSGVCVGVEVASGVGVSVGVDVAAAVGDHDFQPGIGVEYALVEQ